MHTSNTRSDTPVDVHTLAVFGWKALKTSARRALKRKACLGGQSVTPTQRSDTYVAVTSNVGIVFEKKHGRCLITSVFTDRERIAFQQNKARNP